MFHNHESKSELNRRWKGSYKGKLHRVGDKKIDMSKAVVLIRLTPNKLTTLQCRVYSTLHADRCDLFCSVSCAICFLSFSVSNNSLAMSHCSLIRRRRRGRYSTEPENRENGYRRPWQNKVATICVQNTVHLIIVNPNRYMIWSVTG